MIGELQCVCTAVCKRSSVAAWSDRQGSAVLAGHMQVQVALSQFGAKYTTYDGWDGFTSIAFGVATGPLEAILCVWQLCGVRPDTEAHSSKGPCLLEHSMSHSHTKAQVVGHCLDASHPEPQPCRSPALPPALSPDTFCPILSRTYYYCSTCKLRPSQQADC
jgi:hypothetical protein